MYATKAGSTSMGDRKSSHVATTADKMDSVNRFLIFRLIMPYTRQFKRPFYDDKEQMR